MKRSRLVFFFTIALVLSAGIVVGRLWAKLPAIAPTHGEPRTWISDELRLTGPQRQQMDAIWGETRQKIARTFEQRHEADRQRDAAIQQLLDERQRIAYEKIMADERARRTALDQERDRLIHDAEERSRAMLDDSQKKQWDEISKQMHARHAQHGHHAGPGTQPGPDGPPSPWH